MTLIETCPPDVWANMMAERDREIAQAWSPGRFDADAVEAAVAVCYDAIGKPAPHVWWC